MELVSDIRKMMLPYTAVSFREDAKNRKVTLAHYAKELGGPLGVTHILSLSQNESRLNLRLARTPAGPTLTFRVKRFSLSRQVRSVQRRPYDSPAAFSHPPVVVTNNFGDATAPPHVKLLRITFQNMFPAINVASVSLGDCRRVVLFNYLRREVKDSEDVAEGGGAEGDRELDEDEEVEVRHYAVKATPTGVNRRVRRIVQARVPDLSRLEDVADYITGRTRAGAPAPAAGIASGGAGGALSDSEPEDETSHVTLPQKYAGRGNARSQKSALKLVEMGPRLRLKLVKVERGLAAGDVMYHAYVKKTAEEIKTQKARIEKEALEKKRRREVQDVNVNRKRVEKEEKREAKRSRKEEREKEALKSLRGENCDTEDGGEKSNDTGDEEETDEETSESEDKN